MTASHAVSIPKVICATVLIRDHDMKSDSIEDSNTLPNCVARMSIDTIILDVIMGGDRLVCFECVRK